MPPSRGNPRAVDQPRAGFFMLRLVKHGPWVPACIKVDFGVFSAEIDGKPFGDANTDPLKADGVMKIWHWGREVSEAEYQAALKRTVRPDPRKPVDLRKLPPLF